MMGEVVYYEPDPVELPIIETYLGHDRLFVCLDIKTCQHDALIPKLRNLLLTGPTTTLTLHGWIYIIYLFQKMDDARVVPILIEFLEQKVAYKFESTLKGSLKRAVLKVMHYYATSEAKAVIQQYQKENDLYAAYYTTRNRGWFHSYP
jgi:hypothetical protein